jgi:hypothetical protein
VHSHTASIDHTSVRARLQRLRKNSFVFGEK